MERSLESPQSPLPQPLTNWRSACKAPTPPPARELAYLPPARRVYFQAFTGDHWNMSSRRYRSRPQRTLSDFLDEESVDDSFTPSLAARREPRRGKRRSRRCKKWAAAALSAALLVYAVAASAAVVILITGGFGLCSPPSTADGGAIPKPAALALIKEQGCLMPDGSLNISDACADICRAIPGYCDQSPDQTTYLTTTTTTERVVAEEPVADGARDEDASAHDEAYELLGGRRAIPMTQAMEDLTKNSRLNVYFIRSGATVTNGSLVRVCSCGGPGPRRCLCLKPCPFENVAYSYGTDTVPNDYETLSGH